MPEKQSHNRFLQGMFSALTRNQISNVRANFQFKYLNYRTYYIVDTFDIVSNCFPLIFYQDNREFDNVDIAKFIAINSILFESPNPPILMKEYKVEMYSLWYKLGEKIQEFGSLDDLASGIKTAYEKCETSSAKIEFIESNIGLLLALAFGTISRTPMRRYNYLINKRLDVEAVSCSSSSDETILNDIINNSEPDPTRVQSVFTTFCDSVKRKLSTFEYNEKFVYLENTLRDIKVFDRIQRVNELANQLYLERKLEHKYNFFYLSSAPFKSLEIENQFRDNNYLFEYREVIHDTFLRNDLEVYLFNLLSFGNNPHQRAQTSKFLSEFERIQNHTGHVSDLEINERIDPDLIDSIGEFKDFSSQIENTLLKLQSISKYKRQFSDAIETIKDTGNSETLGDLFADVLQRIGKQDTKGILKELNDEVSIFSDRLTLAHDLISSVIKLRDTRLSRVNVRVDDGTDEVRSYVQSHPILLFYKDTGFNELYRNRDSIFNILIDPEKLVSNKDQEALIRWMLPKGTKNNQIRLYTLFIKLFLVGRDRISDSQALEQIPNLLLIGENLNPSIKWKKSGKVRYEFSMIPDRLFQSNLIYFQTWLLRRLNRHDEALEILDDIQAKNEDERLTHSRALCWKNKYYDELDYVSEKTHVHSLSQALKYFETCESKYEAMTKVYPDNLPLKHTLIAISNSICDTITKLYMSEPSSFEAKLAEGRQRIDDLKNSLDSLNLAYKNYPAYNHTEVDLEYCEALKLFNEDKLELAKEKIIAAQKHLNQIVDLKITKGFDPFKRTKRLVKRLYLEIIMS